MPPPRPTAGGMSGKEPTSGEKYVWGAPKCLKVKLLLTVVRVRRGSSGPEPVAWRENLGVKCQTRLGFFHNKTIWEMPGKQGCREGEEERMEADEKKKLAEEIGECAREYTMKYGG